MAQPLSGVRVLEMAQAIAGPFAARTLADMGAEVIKVEQPGVGDMSRRIGPHFLGGESAYYLNFNRNKQSVTIDLRQNQGREVFKRLVAVSDVVFDAFRPSVLDRLGLGYALLKEINPTIIGALLMGHLSDKQGRRGLLSFSYNLRALGFIVVLLSMGIPFILCVPLSLSVAPVSCCKLLSKF